MKPSEKRDRHLLWVSVFVMVVPACSAGVITATIIFTSFPRIFRRRAAEVAAEAAGRAAGDDSVAGDAPAEREAQAPCKSDNAPR